uniref:WD repeat-containing protein 54 isoform X2 n=1 Tax=Myxine glutinosa TaxID=7769 RepID=UPI00358E0F00
MPGMYRRVQSVPLRHSASALASNLAVLRPPAPEPCSLAVVHGRGISLLGLSSESEPGGHIRSQRLLQCKEGGATADSTLILQARWCVLLSRVILVVTSRRGIQMYEEDGSAMLYWQALEQPGALNTKVVFARGVAAVAGLYICVGVSSGCVLVFNIPPRGTNITLCNELHQHSDAISSISGETLGDLESTVDMVSADDGGVICTWKSGEDFTLMHKLPPYGCACTSVVMWRGIVAAAYGTGQIRVYDGTTGMLHADIDAHARWINSLDIAPATGLVLSGSEDSFVRIWKIGETDRVDGTEVAHLHSECVQDVLVCGARFCDTRGDSFAVTGYDLCEILRYVRT